jgi:hypothetical protein
MVNKSDISKIFPQFKNFVETRFQTKINSLYSDNGDKFITLRSFLSNTGISHYTTTLQDGDGANTFRVFNSIQAFLHLKFFCY